VRSFRVPNRMQLLLLIQVSLDSIAPVGSVLRCIDELVDQLDTAEIEKNYDLESEQGREPFHPKTLIKVALYALHNCRFTLRKMEEDTRNHLGYKWLAGDEVIDHSTMGYFLSRYKDQIVELFTQVVLLCAEQELVDFEVLAIDSVKLRANASYKQSRDLRGIPPQQAAESGNAKRESARQGPHDGSDTIASRESWGTIPIILHPFSSLKKLCLVTMAQGSHPFPSRTRKLSPAAPMVLPLDGGRVGRCQAFLFDC
jgi:transposase